MKRRTKAHFLMILLGMGVSLSACSNKAINTSETPYYSLSIDGKKQYKSAEDEDVQKIKELSTGYIELTCGFDYKALENAFDELNYYTEKVKNDYIEYEYIEDSIATMEYYEQVQDLVECNIKDMQFYELYDEESARVQCEYISVVKHATDEYLSDVGVKLDTKYSRVMTLEFVKENGEWKIDSYNITNREEVL